MCLTPTASPPPCPREPWAPLVLVSLLPDGPGLPLQLPNCFQGLVAHAVGNLGVGPLFQRRVGIQSGQQPHGNLPRLQACVQRVKYLFLAVTELLVRRQKPVSKLEQFVLFL